LPQIRLYFIDAVRAFAILMMLQGHFIDTLLAEEYRDSNQTLYRTWEYFRGITAPLFFTISGLIFSYLLVRAKRNNTTKYRLKKGLYRGLMLIGIGYALRIPILSWIFGSFNTYFLVVDVLQCIGLSLILIVIIYKITFRRTFIFSLLMLLLGVIIFTTEPFYRNLRSTLLPLPIENYITKVNGSIFTIVPWFGYMAFGAFISTLFYRYLEKQRFKTYMVTGFILFGLLLIHQSSWLLNKISYYTHLEIFKAVADYNYLFIRLGNVLVIFGLFYLAEPLLKLPLILKIGQKTLSIYVIHFIVLYGSFTGLGLNQLIGKTLYPEQAVFGAILFLSGVCLVSFYYVKTNTFLYNTFRQFIAFSKKMFS